MTRIAIAALFALTSCAYQMSVQAGPRIDAEGRVGVEFGMTLGPAAIAARPTGALVASAETGGYIATTDGCDPCATARRTSISAPAKTQQRVLVRGMLEWLALPGATEPRYVRADGPMYRVGAYGGADLDRTSAYGVVGVTAGVSPWVLRYHGTGKRGIVADNWLALGVRVATEVLPGQTDGHRVVVRALLQADSVYRELH
jgi:hypothetical protein